MSNVPQIAKPDRHRSQYAHPRLPAWVKAAASKPMMKHTSPTRLSFQTVVGLLAAGGVLLFASTATRAERWSGMAQGQAPALIERRPPTPPRPGSGRTANASGQPGAGLPRGEHLAEWMNQHRNLTPEQQRGALETLPGFRDLPAPTQQRMRDRLSQLDAMNPAQRQRVLARTEAMERLTPEQRADVRGAMGQLGSLPPDERREVARAFRTLRELPPEQRIGAYAAGRVGPPLSDTQRGVLFNLLRVEPMLPPPVATPGQPVR